MEYSTGAVVAISTLSITKPEWVSIVHHTYRVALFWMPTHAKIILLGHWIEG